MRYLVTAGAFALALTGATMAPALAATSATLSPATTVASASHAAESEQSPDVAAWTAALVAERAEAREGDATPSDSNGLRSFGGTILHRTSKIVRELTRSALRFLGSPYVFGGTSRAGFDCSGFVQHVFAMLGIQLPRTADAQFYEGRPVKGPLQPGDLVFFTTYTAGPSHVGIYIGNGAFVDATSSRGVTISHLSDPYWSSRYIGARTYLASR